MKKFTVCLYDGSVDNIKRVVAAKTVDAPQMDGFDHLGLFYDLVKTVQHTDHPTYRNRVTGREFTVYYERELMFSDKVHVYDFGGYTRFIAIFEGEYTAEELPALLDKEIKD